MAKRMAEQMELFEPVERGFDEGGLMDEGGMVDEESGNEVPPGSLREEVRDDIPAQLSEGEFVFPADVVRYIGLENLMRMRQEAKQGLAQMEAMGQMGNGDEAVVQDDLPFDMYDLDVDEEEEYNSDELKMQAGGMVPSYDPRTGTYTMPGTGIGGFQPAQQMPNTGFTPYTGTQPYMQPLQYTGTQYTTADQTTNIPTFGQMVGSGYQGSELRTYVNDAGQVLQIPFVDGKPVYPIPDGYKPKGDQSQEETTAVTPTMGQTGVRNDDSGRSAEDTAVTVAGKAIDEQKDVVKEKYAISGRRGIDLLSFVPGGNFVKEVFGLGDVATVFEKDPEAMPTAIGGPSAPFGPADLSGLPGLPMTGLGVQPVKGEIQPAEGLLPASAVVARNLKALQDYIGVTPSRYAGYEKGDLDPVTGGFFDKNGIAIDIRTGGQAKSDNGSMSYASFSDYKEALDAGRKSGWRGGVIDSTTYSGLSKQGKVNYDKFADIMGYPKGGGKGLADETRDGDSGFSFSGTSDKSAADFGKADVATGKGGGVRSEDLDASFGGGVRSEDRDAAVGKEDNSDSGGHTGGSAADGSEADTGGGYGGLGH